jgi:transposase-like protein
MSKRDFCEEHGLSVNSLYYWHKLFRKKEPISKAKQFSPVVAKIVPADHQQAMIQLEIRLPNQVQLFVSLRESNLVSFIQEFSNAVTVIR